MAIFFLFIFFFLILFFLSIQNLAMLSSIRSLSLLKSQPVSLLRPLMASYSTGGKAVREISVFSVCDCWTKKIGEIFPRPNLQGRI